MSQKQRDQKQSNQQTDRVISIRRGMATILVAGLVAATALATFAVTRLTSHGNVISPDAVSLSAPKVLKVEGGSAAPVPQQAGRDEVWIEMSASGFAPSEITHPAGHFALSVENQGVTGEYVLQLKAEDQTLLREVRVQKGSTSWTMELAEGRYTLTETSHPDWVCRITAQ